MLWVGWYGFNAGSAVAADGIAASAFMATTLVTAVASVTWRPSTEEEEEGLDPVDHGEAGYHLEEVGTLAHGHSVHAPLAAMAGAGRSVAGASDR
jgi:ammonia channel protein AmtB